MGIVPRDPDRPFSPTDRILGRNGEDTAETRTQWAQTALEIPVPKQVALLAPLSRLAGFGYSVCYGVGFPGAMWLGPLETVRNFVPRGEKNRLTVFSNHDVFGTLRAPILYSD